MFAMLDQPPPYYALAAAEQPAPAASLAAAGSAGATRQEFTSHGYRYVVVGNRLLSTAEVAAALDGSDTPQAAVAALKKAYEAKGYFLVALVGKVQPDKEVWLQVIQGRLTHIEGPRKLASYFTGLEGNDKVKNSDVIRRSILLQAYEATNGQQPQISFKPAPEVGGSTMQISQNPVPDARWYGASLTTGNFGNRYAGHYLAQAQASAQYDGYTLQLSHSRALTGMDDNTRGAFYAATSANLTKVTPLGTFQFDSSDTRYELGKAFAPLYPGGRIKLFGGSATQLLYADDLHRWSIKEGLHHIRDTGTVFSGSYVLRDQKYNVFDLGTDYAMRFGGFFHQPASVSLSGGVKFGFARGNGGFSHAVGAPDGHFRVYTASADFTQALPASYSLQLSLSGQASPNILPSYQQWVLGGLNNLTAWLPGTVVGDRGYLGRMTLQGPQWKLGPLQLRPSLFAEHGAARYSYIAPKAPLWQGLSDVGASLSMAVPKAGFATLLGWARPVGTHEVTDALRDGQRAHLFFYMQMSL